MNENKTMTEFPIMPHLPEEIIIEILSRLPPISLLKFRCVSKPWSVLFNNPKLINMTKFNKNNFSILIVYDTIMYSIDSKSLSSSSLILDCIQKIRCPEDVDDDYTSIGSHDGVEVFNDIDYRRTRFVGSCNGLVCLHIDHESDDFNFSLWNPSTGDCKVLPSPPDDQIKGYNSVHGLSTLRGYGFGYDSKSDDYKFVCFTSYFKLNQSKVKIYSLRSDSWKRFKKTQKTHWLLSSQSLLNYGVFCNGALHWQSSSLSGALIAFHMTDELVREISQPKTNFEKSGDTTFIGVLDGCFSMLYSNVNVNHGCEVWLMKDYGKKESWTKVYSISKLTSFEIGRFGCLSRIKCLKSGQMLLEVRRHDCGPYYRKALVLYDSKNETSTTLIEDEDGYMSDSLSFHSYVKSSVSVTSSTNVSKRLECSSSKFYCWCNIEGCKKCRF